MLCFPFIYCYCQQKAFQTDHNLCSIYNNGSIVGQNSMSTFTFNLLVILHKFPWKSIRALQRKGAVHILCQQGGGVGGEYSR